MISKRSLILFLNNLLTGWVCLVTISACSFSSTNFTRTETPPVTTPGSHSPRAIKISIEKPGIYTISGAELIESGLGDVSEHPEDLKLYHRGIELPVWINGKGAAFSIRFFGQGSDSLYSRDSIYWLTAGEQDAIDPMKEDPAAQSDRNSRQDSGIDPTMLKSLLPDTYLASFHFEENREYLPQVERGDHWMWESLPAPGQKELGFNLSSIAPGPARLRLALWAGTEASMDPDHHLRVILNGQKVAEESWDGKGQHIILAQLSTKNFRDGANKISLEAPGDTGAAADIIHVDWFDIDFARQPVVGNQQIEFLASGIGLRFTGFNGTYSVYDITDPRHASLVNDSLEPSMEFTGTAYKRYIALGAEGGLHPVHFSAVTWMPNLRDRTLGADYVAIGPEELLKPLRPLLDLRASQGLKTTSVPLSAIYDQFGHGYPEPEAIRNFIQYAARAWQPGPRYLLLVGDASYDPKGYITPEEANQLPTFLIQTIYGGETATDVEFAQINDDPWPDIAVGHMPARNSVQVSVIVQKTLQYEQDVVIPAVVAIADGQSSYFRDDAQSFLDLFSDPYQRTLYAPEAGIVGANQEIKRLFESGGSVIAYFGHGSINMWGRDRLFTTDDVGSLAKGQNLPVVLNMTCLTGLYTHPSVESLTEALLWKPEGGAVAVLAPSSLTLPTDQSFLSRALVEAMLSDASATLGEIHLSARRNVPADDPGTLDVMQTFMLFGDPALRLTR